MAKRNTKGKSPRPIAYRITRGATMAIPIMKGESEADGAGAAKAQPVTAQEVDLDALAANMRRDAEAADLPRARAMLAERGETLIAALESMRALRNTLLRATAQLNHALDREGVKQRKTAALLHPFFDALLGYDLDAPTCKTEREHREKVAFEYIAAFAATLPEKERNEVFLALEAGPAKAEANA